MGSLWRTNDEPLDSSKYFETIAEFVTSSRAGQTALRLKNSYDRGKARVATGLADGGKKAAEPLVQRAKSVALAYRCPIRQSEC